MSVRATITSELTPLTRELLWESYRDYRNPGGEKELFISLGGTFFLALAIGTWEGPSMTLEREHGVCFPLKTNACFPFGLRTTEVSQRIDSYTLAQIENVDAIRLAKRLAKDRADQIVVVDGKIRPFRCFDNANGGLSMVSVEFMPIGMTDGQRLTYDGTNNQAPLGISRITEPYAGHESDDVFSPVIPVFVES